MSSEDNALGLPTGYADWLAQLKSQIAQARQRAAFAVNGELIYMRFFAQHCPDGLIGQQPADQLPWFHIVTLLTKLADTEEREWYALQAVQQGWSRMMNRLLSHLSVTQYLVPQAVAQTHTKNFTAKNGSGSV